MFFSKSLWNLLKPYWVWMGIILLTLMVQTSFRVFVPIGFQLIFDRAIATKDIKYLLTLLLVYLIFWAFQSIVSFFQEYLSARGGVFVINDLRMSMFEKLSHLSYGYLSQVSTGDILTRFSVDFIAIEVALVKSLNVFIFSSLNLLLSAILLFYWQWKLALFALLGMSIAMISPNFLAKKTKEASLARKEWESRIGSTIQENIINHEVIRAFNLWSVRQENFRYLLDSFRYSANRAYFLGALFSKIGSQGAYLVQILIMVVGGFLVISGSLTIGTLVGFVALLQNMVAAISHLSASVPNLIQASVSINRVNEFLAAENLLPQNKTDFHFPRLLQSIGFNNVTFRYREGDPILKNLSFNLAAGKSIAIVGPSGSGKSTLLKLLLRFHSPDTGTVTLDGINIKKGSESSFREQISIVLQDNLLFNATFLENIRMGCLSATKEEVIKAAKSAEIHEWIMEQPDGYNTLIGEFGHNLSGGQRQRIAIARAILRNPSLMLLDEATSALDSVTEKAICNTLEKMAKNRTIVFATHRLNIITNFDQILVIKDGSLIERGHHQQLLEMNGLYRELWEKQSGFIISEDGYRAECTPERLQLIPLLSMLDLASLQAIANCMVSEFYPKDTILFKKGDYGDKFYIIVQGLVEIRLSEAKNKFHKELYQESGDFFGEIALLYDAPRSATVQTCLPTLVLTLAKYQFQNLLQKEPELMQIIEKAARKRRDNVAPF